MKNYRVDENLKNLIELIMLLPVRIRYRREIQSKRKVNIETLVSVRHTLNGATKLNAKNTITVFNVGMYLLLLDQDILYFAEDLACAIGDRRRAFVAKQEAVLLYEASEDIPQLLGRDFRMATKALGASEEQIDQINVISSDFHKFKEKHREFLSTIRNALAAHREHNALHYADDLEKLIPLDVMNCAAEFSQLLNRLIRRLTELGSLISDQAAIVRDMIVSNKEKKDA